MRHKFLIRTLGKAVASSALLAGVMGVVGQATAHAAGSVTAFYVAPAVDGGNDQGGANNCTLAASPCATIKQALSEEATLSAGSVGSQIELAKGTYTGTGNDFSTLSAANDNVTINGTGTKGKKATIVEPTTCAATSDPTLAGGLGTALLAFNGINGVTVQNLVLNGSLAVGACGPTYLAGVDFTGSSHGDAVVGDLVQSGTLFGILTDESSQSTIISNNLAPVLCSSTVKGPNTGLNAGWSTPANIKVKVPKCAQFVESGHGAFTGVFINGVPYCAQSSASHGYVVLTGSPGAGGCPTSNTITHGVEIAKGSTVVFNTSVAPFTQIGIACGNPTYATNNAATTCAISDNTVTAGGTVYQDLGGVNGCGGLPPIGIVGTGGSTTNVDSNTVSNVSDSVSECPEAGETTHDGVGIGFLPDPGGNSAGDGSVIGINNVVNPPTGDGNKLSGNDNGIVVSGGAPIADPGYQVDGNTVSSANQSGIVLTTLGLANGHLVNFEANSVSGVTLGAGIVLQGVVGQTIGGAIAADGNSSTGNGVGMVIRPCYGLHEYLPGPLEVGPADSALCALLGGANATVASTGNTVENNTLNSNLLYGLLKEGPFQPEEIDAPTCISLTADPGNITFEPPNSANLSGCSTGSTSVASTGNIFYDNTWTGNGAGAPSVNGANVMDGTGWGGGCAPNSDCSATPSPLYYEGTNAVFPTTSNSTPFTLLVCNDTATPEPLKAGTEITFYDNQPGLSGTFFVTQTTIAQSNGTAGTGADCNTLTFPYTSLSLQALNPAKVGTDSSPTGQPYILGTGAKLTVNLNGSAVFAGANTFGTGAKANSCTPDGYNGVVNLFGTTNATNHPSSTTLDAGTGGVNATYNAC
jgi:hypothetical protein